MRDVDMAAFEVTVVKVTGKAILLECDDWEGQQWVPKSVCDWDTSDIEPEEGATGTLMIQKWFAKKEGLL